MGARPTPRGGTYAGLFLVTLATLMYELLLTRIFSVTMWYHFAFMAISVAMFGLTVGALLVYLLPQVFTAERLERHLTVSALLFSVTAVTGFLTHLVVPVVFEATLRALGALLVTYTAIALPFVCSGVAVCLVLTRFPAHIGRLYAADLLGAALGCLAFLGTLTVTDAPTAVTVVACVAALAACAFAGGVPGRGLGSVAVSLALLLAGAAVLQAALAHRQQPLLRFRYAKGNVDQRPLYEKWTSFARVHVLGNPDRVGAPFGWGMSHRVPRQPTRQLLMNIDGMAAMMITGFDGDLSRIEFLKYDVVNLAHHLRDNAKVLVIGVGGGRDVLAALAFRQASVTGVEINGAILHALNGVFGDFSGHLDQRPDVTMVHDEARSWVARQTETFDVIQISLIDSWAATAAGALVLTENALYTVEAWKLFLERLTPNGILTVSRWYFSGLPGEVYRMTALARTALAELGVAHPERHLVLVRSSEQPYFGLEQPVGTLLVSRQPFSDADLDTVKAVAAELEFTPLFTPRAATDPMLAAIAASPDIDAATAHLPIDVRPPRDDRPYFFQMLRLRNVLQSERWVQGQNTFNLTAVVSLGLVLLVVVGLTIACIILPLALTTRRGLPPGTARFFVFFLAIGLGFMMVQVSQLQRLIVVLGHPTYGVSVVLFTMLLASGLGSAAVRPQEPGRVWAVARQRVGMLLVVLVAFGVLAPVATAAVQASTNAVRAAVAAASLLPIGCLMGMAFPLGMQLAAPRHAAVTPWFWGLNGAASVTGSVLAATVAFAAGITVAFWIGCACYAVALAAVVWPGGSVHGPT